MPHPRPTRRTLVGAAAWSAPAVVVLAAAPAFAASTTPAPPTFTATTGRTRYGPTPPGHGGEALRSVVFNGFSITPSETSPNLIWMTVVQSTGTIATFGEVGGLWRETSRSDRTAVYTWLGPMQAGVPFAFGPAEGDAAYFHDQGIGASFTLTIQSPAFTPLTLTYGP